MTSVNQNKILANLREELSKVIVGQDSLIERLFIALLVRGHVLLEGVPGLAKTRTLSALTKAIDAKMGRIQFTPDLLPSDLIGTEVYRPQSGDFSTRQGPIFTNLLLADEINRSPAKVQSALLQAMQEREVTIGEETFKLPEPFLVLATQNPLEQEGTYQLPEAQVDRFIMKVIVNYPSFNEELGILKMVADNFANQDPISSINKVLSLDELAALRTEMANIYVDPKIDNYIVSITQATRKPDAFGLKDMIEWGASPRASIALKQCARALAFLRGKNFVSPDEVKEIAHDVLRHRILPSYEAEARGVNSDEIIRVLLKNITVP
jgi:MoxR-like ATPase